MSARKSERLLNVLIALLVSRQYVTKQRLREVIEDYRNASSDEAFEKMFERDKEDLRALGIPIEIGGYDPLFEDEHGYRVVRSAFELPEIALEADEAAVVGLAARVWQHARMASATSDALLKLTAAGVEVDGQALDVLQPVLSADEPSFETFWEAVTSRRPVAFDYRTSTSPTAAPRRLQPWGVVSYASRWYVVGHDLDRGQPRMFRLSRISGDVELTGPPGSFEVPEGTDLRAIAGLYLPTADQADAQTAVLRVRPGHAVGLRHRATSPAQVADDGWERIEVPYGRADALVDEVVALGPDVVLDAPEELRRAVVDRLREVVAAGSGAA